MSEFYTVQDAEMNRFYQLPKILVHDEKYKGLTANEKIAYSILKDRHALSLKNEWVDSENRVFFIFTDKELAEILETTSRTANKIKNNLKKHDLIHMERQGMNQPNILYLKKPKASNDTDRKKTSYPNKKKTSYPDRKKISNPDRKKTSTKLTDINDTDISDIKNLSIEEIEKLDVPIAVQKQLFLNKDRLIDDNINLQHIEILYKGYADKISDYDFWFILANVLDSTKGRIKSIKNVMNRSIKNHMEQSQQPENKQIHNNNIVPEWFKDRDKKKGIEDKKHSNMTISEWVKEDPELSEIYDNLKGVE